MAKGKPKKLSLPARRFTFSSKRFTIRLFTRADYAAWRRAHEAAFPKQNEFDQDKKTEKELTRSEFEKFLRQNEEFRRNGVIFHFGAFEKRTGRLVGSVLLALVTRFNVQSVRISYGIFNNYWKHGFGREIVTASVLFAFGPLKLHRVEAEILPLNRASQALVKSLGFQAEGLRRGAVYFQRKWHDHLVFSLLAEDLGRKAPRPTILR